jgi:hypothetical protein
LVLLGKSTPESIDFPIGDGGFPVIFPLNQSIDNGDLLVIQWCFLGDLLEFHDDFSWDFTKNNMVIFRGFMGSSPQDGENSVERAMALPIL